MFLETPPVGGGFISGGIMTFSYLAEISRLDAPVYAVKATFLVMIGVVLWKLMVVTIINRCQEL